MSYEIIIGVLSIILGIVITLVFYQIKDFNKKKFKLDNIKDIILKSNSNIKIINKANEQLNTEIEKLNNILEVLENAKR
jgi:hypothetical protein